MISATYYLGIVRALYFRDAIVAVGVVDVGDHLVQATGDLSQLHNHRDEVDDEGDDDQDDGEGRHRADCHECEHRCHRPS